MLITDIRGAVSVLNNMDRGLQISCVDAGCWALVTGATNYKCTQCNFDHCVQLGGMASRETEIDKHEPNPRFNSKEYKFQKTKITKIKGN